MAGRAGRKGFDVKGEAYLLCSNPTEANRASRLLSSPVQSVTSVLRHMRMSRLILELITLKLCRSVEDIYETIMSETLLATQVKNRSNRRI